MSEEFMLCDTIKSIEEVNINNYFGNEKIDGERIVALKEGNEVYLFNRRKNEKSKFFPEITEELKKFDFDFTIDGEVASKSGLFNDFQQRGNLRNIFEIEKRRKTFPLVFNVFDVLKINGQDLTKLPLIDRKEYLKQFKNKSDKIIPLDFVEGIDIITLWEFVKKENKEGIILKEKNSKYQFKRSREWLKLKFWKEISIEFSKYEINNAGVKLTEGIYEVQVQNDGSNRVKNIMEKIDKGEKAKVVVQYLDIGNTGKLRMPTCKEVKIGK